MKAAIHFISLLLLLLAAASLEAKKYRSDYVDYPEVGAWFKLHRVPADWHEARLRCHLEGSNLASPLDKQISQVMQSIMDDNKLFTGIFTGIHAIFSRGDFASVEGVPLERIPHQWAPDEPDNANNAENCIAQMHNGSFADVRCNDIFPYICYRNYTSQDLNACGTFDSEYQLNSRTGSCYKFHLVPRTWSRAHMTCTAEGGHLAVVNSDTEATVLAELLKKYPASKLHSKATLGNEYFFTGFHDWNEIGEWLTIQGQTLEQVGYSKWERGQPNNITNKGTTGGQSCGSINRSALLNDLWCQLRYHFICEKEPDSLLWNDDDFDDNGLDKNT